MKHIIIFDMNNCQKDYSYVIENIKLLNDIEWLSINKLEGFLKIGKNKETVTRCETNRIPSIRYFECPMGETVPTSYSTLLNKTDVIKKYYDKLIDISKNEKADSTVVLSELSSLFYRDENGKANKAQVPLSLTAKMQKRQNVSNAEFINAVKSEDVYFHVRIRVNKERLFDLQYLALLLRHYKNLVSQNRISVVLLSDKLPFSYFPFCNPGSPEEIKEVNESHIIFSRYLRLLSKDYTGIIFAPKYIQYQNAFKPDLFPMDFKLSSAGSSFFPLMTIDNVTYHKLFVSNRDPSDTTLSSEIRQNDLWQSDSDVRNKQTLFNTKGLRFYNANSDDPNAAFLAYIAETSWNRLKCFISEYDELQALLFKKTVSEKFAEERNNWLTFALFSFIYSADNVNDRNQVDQQKIDRTYKTAREMSAGLQQLMQNSVQHSNYKSCVFTFYVDDNNILRIYVVDMNTNMTLIDTFKNRLAHEINVFENSKYPINESIINNYRLMANSSEIRLPHFFNVFADDECNAKAIWRNFRSSDCTSHIGLFLFYQAVVHCRADFIVRSENTFVPIDQKNYFVMKKSGQAEESTHNLFDKQEERSIPGTQYLITLSLNNLSDEELSGGASLSGCNFIEDYSSFSSAIGLKPNLLTLDKMPDIIECVGGNEMTDPDAKLATQLKWESYLKDQMITLQNSNSALINFWYVSENDGEYFNDATNCEVFIKGLFGALNNCTNEKPLYLAFTNLPRQFLEIFREILVSFSCKRFKSNIQLYLIDKKYKLFVHIIGNTIKQAVMNAVGMSIEHGSPLFRPDDSASSAYIASLAECNDSGDKLIVVPFDILVPSKPDSNNTIFETRLLNIVEQNLDGTDSYGYKLVDTHTKLGSKVHIQSFYEMSFLFYRTTIANRIAFKIFKIFFHKMNSLINERTLSVKPIMYYSYSSYSKAIVTSLVEITKLYLADTIKKYNDGFVKLTEEELRKKIDLAKAQVAFASYQYNLQSETTMDAIQLFFSFSKNYSGATLSKGLAMHLSDEKPLELLDDINLITIVPISSTLTTFEKMLEKLYSYRKGSSKGNFILANNFTAFWIGDCECRQEKNKILPSDIEKDFWQEADSLSNCITIRTEGEKGLRLLKGNPQIYYFMRATTVWNQPLKCKLCFPNEPGLINEVPLVETDLTSTVPSQQIRSGIPSLPRQIKDKITQSRREFHIGKHDKSTNRIINGNNHRIKMLRGCVYYGHIERGKNHFQYYISTQDFFYKDEVKDEIREWLSMLKEDNDRKKSGDAPKLQIIFSPEHNTNVGFAQYVNTYYFNGSAEIISINEDKEFRTNFICEHEAIRQTIDRLHRQQNIFDRYNPIEFYFADDNINTGDTIKKANSFLRSLVPEKYLYLYPPIIIKKIFVLIDRLSNASKGSLVLSGDPSDCHAFVHVDISHMRRQGDSCVGCKLRAESKRLFSRSPLRTTANYWAKKYLRLIPVDFDDIDRMSMLQKENYAYERLVLSHIAQNYIFSDGVITRKIGEYYDSIIGIFELIISVSEKKHIGSDKNNFYFCDLLVYLVEKLSKQGENNVQNSKADINANNKKACLVLCELLIKLLSRPFFSYDFSFRNQMQTFLLILSECYLGIKCGFGYINITGSSSPEDMDVVSEVLCLNVEKNNYKGFLVENDRIKRTVKIANCILMLVESNVKDILYFFKDVIFESLADLKSTYLLRKSVIERIGRLVKNTFSNSSNFCDGSLCNYLLNPNQCLEKSAEKCFWITYSAHIHKITDGNTDEIRSLWFYYYMLTGKEITADTYLNNATSEFAELNSNLNIDLFLLTSSLERDTIEMYRSFLDSNSWEDDSVIKSYYLSNFSMQRTWAGMNSRTSIATADWLRFLEKKQLKQIDVQDKNPISLRYSRFTDKLYNMLKEVTGNNAEFYVAVLSAGSSEELNIDSNAKINFEEIHILSDCGSFGNTEFDLKQERYIIKDRILDVWNNNCYNIQSNGYYIELGNADSQADHKDYNSPQYNSCHHITNNYHKPYVIVYFDNPGAMDDNLYNDNSIGRKLTTLSKVFLYIGINNFKCIEKLPLLVLREILSCRDMIMHVLEDDFDGEIMQKHAKSIQEEMVITHERSASHASTTDERGVLQVFGIGDVSALNFISHPIDLKSMKLLNDNRTNSFHRAELWLLFQNYVNGQIARLFNRAFCLNNNAQNDEDVPKLYLGTDKILESDTFKKPAKTFGDFNFSEDERFNMLKTVIHLSTDIDEKANLFSTDVCEEKVYYNCEFLKCILFDIFFSAIKFATTDASFLARVDNLIWYYNSNQPSSLYSYVFMFRENENMIILNNVNSNRIDTSMCDQKNEEIYRRNHDPLDYGDGHMSLFTIRQFILGIRNLNKLDKSGQDNDGVKYDTEFRYIKLKETEQILQRHKMTLPQEVTKDKIWFLTQLPIFMEDTDNEHSNLD